ncbi:MAG: thioredoxin [Candidatus Woesearchaeota archaeon]
MVSEINDETFDSKVIKSSMHTPVVVDFWAPWCSPCLALGPVLEKLEKDYRGKFFLAKINVDSNPKKSQQLGIRGIPAVKMFKNGKITAEFVGTMPELSVKAWLDKNL